MIERVLYPPASGKRVNLAIGSGRMGACLGPDGLMQAATDPNVTRVGQTVLMHADHWHQGLYGIDQHIPLLRLHWLRPPEPTPDAWSQRLDTRTGLLSTRLGRSGPIVHASCHLRARDVMGFAFEGRNIPDVLVSPIRDWSTCYGERLQTTHRTVWHGGGPWRALIRLGTAKSLVSVFLEGSARARPHGDRLRIVFGHGPARLFLAVTPADSAPPGPEIFPGGDYFDTAARAWKRNALTGRFHTPSPRLERLATNCFYHLSCAYSPAPSCPPPPMGWTGNAWGFHFPQDVSYIHPVFLRSGRHDFARGLVDFYASRMTQAEESTRRIYGLPGTMWAWEFPIGPATRILPDGKAPNPFHFEIHNAAYPARMALETVLATGDLEWGRAVAWPVVLGSAEFYSAALRRGRDRLWGIHLKPSMGQDEFGGKNAPDYLCALFAARYTLRAALKLSSLLRIRHPDRPRWKQVLAEGLAFPRLFDRKTGVYATSGRGGWRPHRQKHPVQLSPYVFLPQSVDAATRRAYQIRHQLCANDRPALRHPGTGGSYYDGWTLFAYALASARADDPAALAEILAELEIAQLTDHEHVQIYESSGFWKPYYTTSMGLFLQCVMEDEEP